MSLLINCISTATVKVMAVIDIPNYSDSEELFMFTI